MSNYRRRSKAANPPPGPVVPGSMLHRALQLVAQQIAHKLTGNLRARSRHYRDRAKR
jgi:hypothetical protein